MKSFVVHVRLEWRVEGADRITGGRTLVQAKSAGHAEQLGVAKMKKERGITSLHRCKVRVFSVREA